MKGHVVANDYAILSAAKNYEQFAGKKTDDGHSLGFELPIISNLRGAAIEEPRNRDNGSLKRAFIIRDPDGYHVAVNETR